MSEPIRVMVVDDHPIFREGLAELLKVVPQVEVISVAQTGREAVAAAKELSPDVILMDIVMPDLNGVIATQQILRDTPGIGIIMLTMLEDDETVFASMCAGARGYLLKGSDKADVLDAIKLVAGGGAIFGPAVADRISQIAASASRADRVPFPELTAREREVLDQIARGASNRQIAVNLHISQKTVSNHVSNIFNKLQVSERAQAIVKARDAGLGNIR